MSETKPNTERRALRILLVDDNQANRLVGASLLKRFGHTITLANDGREALDLLDKETFDVVLMDVEMPRMNGIEATQAIREREAGTGAHIPIIALTAYAADRDRQRTLAAGMDEHVAKPFDKDALLACIERVTSGQTTPDAAEEEKANDVATRILAGVEGDLNLLATLAKIFIDDVPVSLSQIRNGIDTADYGLIARTAHTLRGSAGIFGAYDIVNAAGRLENAAKDEQAGQNTPWNEIYEDLEKALTDFTPVLIATSGINT